MNERRIYVGCLGCYNEGRLHGIHIETEDKTIEEMDKQTQAMLKECSTPNNPHEEWAIHDSENLPNIGEHTSFEEIVAMEELIEEHGEVMLALLNSCDNTEEAKDKIEHYITETKSLSDYLYEMYNSEVPGHLQYYMDWDAMARSEEIDTYLVLELDNGNVAIFYNGG